MVQHDSWKSLVRFRDGDGNIQYGEPDEGLKKAVVWKGDDLLALSKTSDIVDVREVLAPYVADTIICIGLNYKEHAAESGVSLCSHKRFCTY